MKDLKITYLKNLSLKINKQTLFCYGLESYFSYYIWLDDENSIEDFYKRRKQQFVDEHNAFRKKLFEDGYINKLSELASSHFFKDEHNYFIYLNEQEHEDIVIPKELALNDKDKVEFLIKKSLETQLRYLDIFMEEIHKDFNHVKSFIKKAPSKYVALFDDDTDYEKEYTVLHLNEFSLKQYTMRRNNVLIIEKE